MSVAPAPYSASCPSGSATSTITSQAFTNFIAGQTLFFDFYYLATRITGVATDTITAAITWYNSSNASLGTTSNVTNVNGSTSGFQFVENQHVPPANAVKGIVTITITPVTTTQHNIWISGIRVAKTAAGATVGADLATNVGNATQDYLPNGSTYGRTILTRLSAGRPVIDFFENIHSNKNLASVDPAADTKLTGVRTNAGMVLDTRAADSAPSVYYGYGLGVIHEFKNANFSSSGSSGFGALETITQWTDASGGPVQQTLTDSTGVVFQRISTSTTTWGSWVKHYTGFNKPGMDSDVVDGSTYARPLASRLNAGKPVIDFSEGIHSNKNLANLDSAQDTKLTGIATGATKNSPRGTWSSSSVAYALNDLVYYSGTIYINILAYTSSATTPPNDATHWTPYSAVSLDTLGDGSTYGRPLLTRLNAGNPLIDFAAAYHVNKNMDNVADGSTYSRPLATRISSGKPLIDFSEGIHLNKGALATKNSVDPSTSDVSTTGSIPPSIPNNSFTFTYTSSSLNFSWPSFTVYRADGTSITISSGTTGNITGLLSGRTYYVYPYVTDTGGTTGTVSFVTSGESSPQGTPAYCFLNTANDNGAIANMYLRGQIPLNKIQATTPVSGTGSGSGGGSACPHPDTLVGDVRAGDLKVGDTLACPTGETNVTALQHLPCREWIVVCCNGVRAAKVSLTHKFIRPNGEEVRANELCLGQLLATNGDHAEVTGLLLEIDDSYTVQLEVEKPHLYYLGPMSLLSHNIKYA